MTTEENKKLETIKKALPYAFWVAYTFLSMIVLMTAWSMLELQNMGEFTQSAIMSVWQYPVLILVGFLAWVLFRELSGYFSKSRYWEIIRLPITPVAILALVLIFG